MGIPSNNVSIKIKDDSFKNYINALIIKFHHKYENEQKIYFIIGGSKHFEFQMKIVEKLYNINDKLKCYLTDVENSSFWYDYIFNETILEVKKSSFNLFCDIDDSTIVGAFRTSDNLCHVACSNILDKLGFLVGPSSGQNAITSSILSHQISEGIILFLMLDDGIMFNDKALNCKLYKTVDCK